MRQELAEKHSRSRCKPYGAEDALTDEGGGCPEGADLQGRGLKRKDPGPVLGSIAVGTKRCIHQALVQSKACRAAQKCQGIVGLRASSHDRRHILAAPHEVLRAVTNRHMPSARPACQADAGSGSIVLRCAPAQVPDEAAVLARKHGELCAQMVAEGRPQTWPLELLDGAENSGVVGEIAAGEGALARHRR